jgi:hypothetical protein
VAAFDGGGRGIAAGWEPPDSAAKLSGHEGMMLLGQVLKAELGNRLAEGFRQPPSDQRAIHGVVTGRRHRFGWRARGLSHWRARV